MQNNNDCDGMDADVVQLARLGGVLATFHQRPRCLNSLHRIPPTLELLLRACVHLFFVFFCCSVLHVRVAVFGSSRLPLIFAPIRSHPCRLSLYVPDRILFFVIDGSGRGRSNVGRGDES